jgi:ferredoxin
MSKPDKKDKSSRREVLKSAGVIGGLIAFARASLGSSKGYVDIASEGGTNYIRPPGAVNEEEFLRRCIRCHKCGENCSAGCIKFVGPEGPPEARGTPYIVPREKGCVLCQRCNNGCPSGALQPIDPDHESLWEEVDMGVAVVDENICNSFHG